MLVIVAVIGLGSWLGWFGWHGAVLIVLIRLRLPLLCLRLLLRDGHFHARLVVILRPGGRGRTRQRERAGGNK